MPKYQCFIDTSDISDVFMMVLPSPLALDNESLDYFDDYYIDLSLSSVEGKIYTEPSKITSPEKSPNPAPKEAIATVHLKVFLR